MNSMSSQPTTPKPSSATATAASDESPTLESNTTNDTTPSSSSPLDQQQQKYAVTPTNGGDYSPHTNTIRTTAHRKDSIVPNLNETCPCFGITEYNHNIVSMDRHSM
jgi:hypothetical protein